MHLHTDYWKINLKKRVDWGFLEIKELVAMGNDYKFGSYRFVDDSYRASFIQIYYTVFGHQNFILDSLTFF